MRRITECILVCSAALTLASAAGASLVEGCLVQVPLYGPKGERIDAKVSRVTVDNGRAVDVLSSRAPTQIRVRVLGDSIAFPKRLLRQTLRVTVTTPTGSTIAARVPLFACRQRTSIRTGLLEAAGDFYAITVKGRLTGCSLSGDWWVRAMPMFGSQFHAAIYEGIVEPDGTFFLSGNMSGERYIVVIGRDGKPVKTIAVDVVEGGNNDVGAVNLRGLCPQ